MNRTENMKKNYNMTDLMKWIMSVGVIAVHTQLFAVDWTAIVSSKTGNTLNLVSQILLMFSHLSVPFFFMASAFFLAKKINWEEDNEKNSLVFKNNAFRILRLYLIWSAIYLIPTAICFITDYGFSPVKTIKMSALSILLGGSTPAIHLWFLFAMFLTLLLINLVMGRKTGRLWIVVLIAVICFGISVYLGFLNAQPGDYALIMGYTNSMYILVAPIYMCIGMICAKHQEFLKNRIPMWLKTLIFIGSLIFLFWCGHHGLFSIGKPFAGVALFILVISINIGGNPKVFRTLRKLSMYAYLVHLWIFMIAGKLFDPGHAKHIFDFLFVVILSNVFGLIVLYIKEKGGKETYGKF